MFHLEGSLAGLPISLTISKKGSPSKPNPASSAESLCPEDFQGDLVNPIACGNCTVPVGIAVPKNLMRNPKRIRLWRDLTQEERERLLRLSYINSREVLALYFKLDLYDLEAGLDQMLGEVKC